MKKQFLNLGKALSRAEQRSVNGANNPNCDSCANPENMNLFPNECACNSNSDCCSGNCKSSIFSHFGTCKPAQTNSDID